MITAQPHAKKHIPASAYRIAVVLGFSILIFSSCATRQEKTQALKQPNFLKSFEVVTNLDLEITETSGLATYNNQLLTHNDSGGTPSIYSMDTTGTITARKDFNQLRNVDWEDIATSNTHLFIADIGNNYGNRVDLKIYKMPWAAFEGAVDSIMTLQIKYEEQLDYTPHPQKHSYDGEAIVYDIEHLLLFSKDWVDFTTQVYAVNIDKNVQSLTSLQDIAVKGLITGAATNSRGRIVLCGYNNSLEPFIVVLERNSNKKLEFKERIALPLENGAQIEAITYFNTVDNLETYYLTSEAVQIKLGDDEAQTKGQLYKMKLQME